jgi:hypothetical protein
MLARRAADKVKIDYDAEDVEAKSFTGVCRQF